MKPYASLQTLARSGATSRAWEAFVAAGLDQNFDDPALLTLKGRLLKDRARATSGSARTQLFARAGEAYVAAAALCPKDSYPLINAAAMALLASDRVKAELYASQVLHLIDSGADPGETPYWRDATRAEALLLLDRVNDAKAVLTEAIALAPAAWEDRAATLRQFSLILQTRGQEADWLDPMRPPPVLHFSGIMGIAADDAASAASIVEAVKSAAPGVGYGALAAGSDIIAAEALVELGAELHVVLPCAADHFRTLSVIPFGTGWRDRFDRLMEQAASVEYCFDTSALTRAAIRQADAVAMGQAVLKAAQFECHVQSLQIVRAGSDRSRDIWRPAGRSLTELTLTTSLAAYPPEMLEDGSIRFHVAQGESGEAVVTDHATVAEALGVIGPDGGAISCSLDDQDAGGQAEALALFKARHSGMLTASHNVALAALAAGNCQRIEPLGEMALASGPVPVYALVRNPA